MTTHAITPHTRIENDIIDHVAAQIGIYGLGIYTAIKRHLNTKTGECFPSYKTIARKLGIDRGTVIRYVKKLKAVNLIDPAWRFKEDGSPTSNQYNFRERKCPFPQDKPDKGSGTEPPPVVAQDNHPGCTKPPEQSEPNKKQRSISDVDFFPEKNPYTSHSGHSPSHTRPQEPMISERQRTCSHPASEVVILPDVTICHHCYGLLDDNLKLVTEDKPVENVCAA